MIAAHRTSLRRLPLLLLLLPLVVTGGWSQGIPKIVLKHTRNYPDGSQQLEQVLLHGRDTIGTIANVRAFLLVREGTNGAAMRDGTRLAYRLTVPFGHVDSTKLVLMLRGYGDEQYNWNEAQLRLASLGYPSVAVDMRGVGTSGGRPTFGIEEGRDLLEMIAHVRRGYHLGNDGVAIIARGYGAAVALEAARLDRAGAIRALLAEGLFPDFDRMAERTLPASTLDSLRDYLAGRSLTADSLNPAHSLQQITDLPILFVWGEHDQYVSERERGIAALSYRPAKEENRQVLIVREMMHGLDRDPRLFSEEEYQRYLGQREIFIRHYLPPH
jgi:pimeloyl-ACP methyl ester carboxylesterase